MALVESRAFVQFFEIVDTVFHCAMTQVLIFQAACQSLRRVLYLLRNFVQV